MGETENRSSKRLVFVYNADSGFFSKVADFAHKLLSPQTYSCSLCRLTHGHMGMNQEWAEFTQGLPYEITFLYRDHVGELRINEKLPIVVLQEGNEATVLVSSSELNATGSLDKLMELIKKRL